MHDDSDINWSRKSTATSGGPHRDYPSNLMQCREFCKSVKPHLYDGMKVEVCGSHGLVDSLLMISWMPPRAAPKGNYATPIFLHQPNKDMSKKIELIFNAYMKAVQDFNASLALLGS